MPGQHHDQAFVCSRTKPKALSWIQRPVVHAGVACSCGTDPPACGTPPPGGTSMTFHSLRCLICLADVSIIPSAKRYDLPLEGGFRGDRRLTPLATARLSGFLLALPHRLAEPHGAAELLVAASLGDPAVVEHHDLADLAGHIALVGDERRAGWQGAGRRRLCPISLCRSSLGSTAHGTALPPVRRKLSLRGRARCPARAAAGPPPSAPRSRGHTGGQA